MAYDPAVSSIIVFQKDPTKLVGTVSVVGISFDNSSVTAVLKNSSVTALQGTNPWQVNMPSPSVVAYQAAGSIMAVSGSFSASPQNSIIAIQAAGSVTAVRTDNASVVAVLSNSSVTALQGTNPWQINVPSPSTIAYQAAGSIMAVSGSFTANPQSSIIAIQLAGSIMAVSATVNTGNSSVQLLQGVAVIGSVATLQGTNPWLVNDVGSVLVAIKSTNGSVVAILSNSSVTALQGTNPWQVNVPTPSYIAYQAAGSIMAVSATVNTGNSSVQLLGSQAVIGSVAVLQGTDPWKVNVPSPSYIAYQLAGSVMAVAATVNTGNSSVQLLGGVAVIGSVATLQGTNPWIVTHNNNSIIAVIQQGNSSVTGTMSVLGTVPVTQSTSPWVVNVPTPSYIAYQLAGSIMAVAATVNTGNSSVQLLGGIAVIGSVATLQGTNPWQVNVPTPSYIAYQLAGSVMQVTGGGGGTQYLENAQAASVTGTAVMFKSNMTTSILTVVTPATPLPVSVQGNVGVTNPNSSVMLTASTNHSVIAVLSNSSVTALQGTTPWTIGPSSVQLMSTSASIITNQNYGYASVMLMASTNASIAALVSQNTNPWVIGSIVGTYAEDSAHTTGDKGLLAFGVRNDTVASLVNADLDYGAWAQDSAGRHLVKPFVSEDATLISYNGSVVSTSVTLIAASIIGKRSYITDFWVTNSGATTTVVQFRENGTSVIGTTIAPTGGGSNSPGIAVPIKTNGQGLDLSFTGLTATSILYLTVKGYQAP